MDDLDSLRICPECDCRFCFEAAAEPWTPDSWLLVVQCPNCWNAWRLTVSDLVLRLFEHALDEDGRCIEATLTELADANERAAARQLEDEVERFAAALEAGAILPIDF
jgi:hypothetical protein